MSCTVFVMCVMCVKDEGTTTTTLRNGAVFK
jgi:hypothetical protein